MYEADQADRKWETPPTEEQWEGVSRRDEERRDRVLEIVRAGDLKAADDYYHAAMVLQHGKGSEDIMISHILATVAGFKGHDGGRWLSAASLDRYLHRTEAPQRLGTQYIRVEPEDPWSMGEYADWLPDSIRAEYGVPPLADQAAYAEKLNSR